MVLHGATPDALYQPLAARVLVADDDPGHRAILHLLLAADGHAVTVVEGGRAALAFLKDHTPDLVVLDAAMPDVSGLEICARLKLIRRLKAVPVLLLTEPRDEGSRAEAAAAGASAVISKPLSGKNVRALVRALLHGRPG
jgi:DNA-binding response OmpR family regulator